MTRKLRQVNGSVYGFIITGYPDIFTARIDLNHIAQWCKDTYGNEYETWNILDGCVFTFTNDEDAMAFKLRWL